MQHECMAACGGDTLRLSEAGGRLSAQVRGQNAVVRLDVVGASAIRLQIRLLDGCAALPLAESV